MEGNALLKASGRQLKGQDLSESPTWAQLRSSVSSLPQLRGRVVRYSMYTTISSKSCTRPSTASLETPCPHRPFQDHQRRSEGRPCPRTSIGRL